MQVDAEAVQAIRFLAGWSPSRFATEIGITPSHLSNIESGRRQASPEVIKRMADVLGVPVTALVKPREVPA